MTPSTRHPLLAVLFMILLLGAGAAQQTTPTKGTGGTAPPPPPVAPPPVFIPSPTPAPRVFELPPREIHPIFLSGNVVREDGSPPPFGTIIELDCGSTKTREASVGSNGYFSFQYGGAQRFRDIVPDASEGTGHINDEDAIYWSPLRSSANARIETTTPLAIRLSGCDLRAEAAGYLSSSLRLNPTTLGRVNAVGTIVVYPIERVQGTTVSAASLLVPKQARKKVERARKAAEKEKFAEAEALLRDALAEHADYGEAWLEMGDLHQRQKRYGEAREDYQRAIDADPRYVPPYVQLGWLNTLEQKWQETVRVSEKVLVLDPVTFPEAYYLSALAHYNLGDYERAGRRAEQAIGRDSAHAFPHAHLILANVLDRRKDAAGADEAMRRYLQVAPDGADAETVRARLENGRPVPPERR